MKFFPDAKTFVRFGSFDIAWYAILILSGAFIAVKLSQMAGKKRGIKPEAIEDMAIGAILVGIIGARLWYVLFYPDISYFLNNPMKILAFRDGGLAIQGGLFAGAAYVYFMSKKKNINFIDLADSVLPNVLIAQAVGRWGNFLNQEAFGQVVSESFYRGWPLWFKNQMFIDGAYRQPMFLLESSLNILGFLLIFFLLKKIKDVKKGDYAYSYLLWYGIVRFIVEHYRSDSLMLFNFKSAQLVSIVFVVIGAMGLFGVFRKKKKNILVLFDWDGTLANSNPLIIDSFNKVFNKYFPDMEISREMEVSYVGPTLDHTFKKYLKLDNVDKYVQEYRRLNFIAQKEDLTEIKNATKLLKNLKSHNVTMGLVSSKFKDSLNLGVEVLDMKEYFEIVVGGDEVEKTKPDPEGILMAKKRLNNNADKCFYVGDTVSDMLAAKAANFVSIGLLGVEEIKQDIINVKPDYVVNDLMEVIKIIEEEVKWKNMI